MKAILFFAVLALAVQAQSPVHEFFHTFVANLHMDAATQNQVLVDGFECINYALTTVQHFVETIETNPGQEDLVARNVREAITSIETLEHEVVPRCVGAYAEIAAYLNQHHDVSYINTQTKGQLFVAKLVQLAGQTVFGAMSHHDATEVAENLANLINVASGLVHTELPYTLEIDSEKFVAFNNEKFFRGFFKGFFTTLGFNNLAEINATAECALDVSNVITNFFMNPALHHGDELAVAHTFLNGVMNFTNAYERCKQLNMVDTSSLNHKLISLWTEETAHTLVTYFYNMIMSLPNITQAQINMGVYMTEGEYEVAGQLYAAIFKKAYENLLF